LTVLTSLARLIRVTCYSGWAAVELLLTMLTSAVVVVLAVRRAVGGCCCASGEESGRLAGCSYGQDVLIFGALIGCCTLVVLAVE
jgi:hypothetical protein